MNVGKHLKRIRELAAAIGRPVRLMEVCGTHTMVAFRSGLRSVLPENVTLLSGPGCPVCVTPNSVLDYAVAVAGEPDIVTCTFGDMLRVPGTQSSLERARALGAKVKVVYSPMDALAEAAAHPEQRIVFIGVGFETTAPAVAWTIRQAKSEGISNYSVLCAHKTMPRAMAALLSGGATKIDGFMCPGHVSVVIGANAYEFICRDWKIPCVVAGFEPMDMIRAVEMLLQQTADKRAVVEIQYTRSVTQEGNKKAQVLMEEVFEPCDAEWRGLGVVPGSGLKIRDDFKAHDATRVFGKRVLPEPATDLGCICGDVLRGTRTPLDCPLFGRACSPTKPVGACMVSSEGSCAAYFKYAVRSKGTER